MPNPGVVLGLPDELMIDWGITPPGSTATIYWPGLDAYKVLALAEPIYASHLLKAVGPHTLEVVTARGVTYIPIPHLGNLAGLMTIRLPETITHGQVFDILVRRLAIGGGTLKHRRHRRHRSGSRRALRPTGAPAAAHRGRGVGKTARTPSTGARPAAPSTSALQ